MASKQSSILAQYSNILNAPEVPLPGQSLQPLVSPSQRSSKSEAASTPKKQKEVDIATEPANDEILPVKVKRVQRSKTAQDIDLLEGKNFVMNVSLPDIDLESDSQCVILDFQSEFKKIMRSVRPVEETVVAQAKARTVKFNSKIAAPSPSPLKVKQQKTIIIDDEGSEEDLIGDYDYNDPFIDDEEDFFMEQLLHKPQIDGYFAWKGVVPTRLVTESELLRDHLDVEQPEDVTGSQMDVSLQSLAEQSIASVQNTATISTEIQETAKASVVLNVPSKPKTPSKPRKKPTTVALVAPQDSAAIVQPGSTTKNQTDAAVPTPKKKRRKKLPPVSTAEQVTAEIFQTASSLTFNLADSTTSK